VQGAHSPQASLRFIRQKRLSVGLSYLGFRTMPDTIADLLPGRTPDAEFPLHGVTLLLVEDSRFASEAVRLMCLRSGARLRRADCLRAAERHLQCYRPTVALIDLGLPDGSGLDLIARLARQTPRLPAIIAMSGDASAGAAALSAGADRFLAKPVESLGAFRNMLLTLLPDLPRARTAMPQTDGPAPDRAALRDDLARAAALIAPGGQGDLTYVARFLSGLAVSSRDGDLGRAAAALLADQQSGAPVNRICGLLRDRLAASAGF
jgi:CheY-like chemotaxis protein